MSAIRLSPEDLEQTGSARTFIRFLGYLRQLRRLLPLVVLVSVAASFLPQLFFWMLGSLNPNSAGPGSVAWLHRHFPLITTELLTTIAVGALVCRIFAWLSFEGLAKWSTQTLHSDMMNGLLRVRTSWFDEHPSGEVLNRFQVDYGYTVNLGVINTNDLLQLSLEMLALGLTLALVSPWVACVLGLTLVLFLFIQVNAVPMLARLRARGHAASGEVLAAFGDVLEGASIYEIYGKIHTLNRRLAQALRTSAQLQLLELKVDAWMWFWTSLAIDGLLVCTFAITAWAVADERIPAVMAGVALSAVFQSTSIFPWMTFTVSSFGRTLASVRRTFEMADLPSEETEERTPPFAIAPIQGSSATAVTGDIDFVNFTMSYTSSSPIVLRDLNLTLPAGRRIAFLGRTGSGKSSLLQSLLRMVHVHAGDIRIGGTSLFEIPIHEARELFGVVPQTPWLFSGTLRENLSPYSDLADSTLCEALDRVGLRIPLDTEIQSGQEALSVGERQLICLARCLLKNKSIILMDEPTSALDSISDHRVQDVIRREFRHATILTVAHRLESVQDYDILLEARDGRFHPRVLAPNP